MSIPTQLPQLVIPARSGALQALALQAGQVLEGKVIGAAPNGGTQVEIRGQMLNLLLPTLMQAGATLKLEVQGSGNQLRLALQVPTPLPAAPANPAPLAPPATTIQQPMPAPQPSASPPPVLPQAPAAPAPLAAGSAAPATRTTTPAPTAAPQTQAGFAGQAPAVPVPSVTPPRQAIPYPTPGVPQAIPGSGVPQTAGQAPGSVLVPPMASATAPTGAPAPAAAPRATTPQAALANMVQASVPRQGPITGLTAALTGIAGKVALPEPVIRAAQQVLAGRVAIAGPRFDGGALQKALLGSGVFQEAALAKGQLPLPQADMKSALLVLRQTLSNWLGPQAQIAPVAHIPPPLRGSVPRGRVNDAPPLDPAAAPEEIGRQLLERTESALSRVRLHQNASLPDPVAKGGDWSMDLPVMVGTQQTLMQFHIHRDPEGDNEAQGDRGWQMRFALSLPDMGEVGAQVSLRAGATGVMLWASDPHTMAQLEAEAAALRETLADAGLKPGAVIVRQGAPNPPAAPSGHFVDSRT